MLLRAKREEFRQSPIEIREWLESLNMRISSDMIDSIYSLLNKEQPVLSIYGNTGTGKTLCIGLLMHRLRYEFSLLKNPIDFCRPYNPVIAIMSKYYSPLEQLLASLSRDENNIVSHNIELCQCNHPRDIVDKRPLLVFLSVNDPYEDMFGAAEINSVIEACTQDGKNKRVAPSVIIEGWLPNGLNMDMMSIDAVQKRKTVFRCFDQGRDDV